MKTKLLGIASLLTLNVFAVGTSSIAVKDVEVFWPVHCHPTKGVQSYDLTNNLRRLTGVDAFGANLSYSAYDHKADKFSVKGVVYGYKCEKQTVTNGEKQYKWKIVSLKGNESVRPRVSSVKYGILSSNFPIELNDNYKFQVEASSKEFLGGLRSKELKAKKDIGRSEFHIVFDVIDTSNSFEKTRMQSPFFVYKYELKDQGDLSQMGFIKE